MNMADRSGVEEKKRTLRVVGDKEAGDQKKRHAERCVEMEGGGG